VNFQGGKMNYPNIRTGDILVRAGNAKGPFGLPFSKLVQICTKSKYSHASIAFLEFGSVYLLETNENGTSRSTLKDWIEGSTDGHYAVYRSYQINQKKVKEEIYKKIKERPLYDYRFNDDNKYYCVELVVDILKKSEVEIAPPKLPREVLPWWAYYFLFYPINYIIGKLTNQCFPTDIPLYFVGNEKSGLISSDTLSKIAEL
jgi:hypothetical protein